MITLKTNYGEIKIELDQKNTPITSENFLKYVKSGFYDGTVFHRVIDHFMIQGGGFSLGMKEKKPNQPIANEAEFAMPNKRGTLAMARLPDPHSASAQFFINVKDNDFLNFRNKNQEGYGYCVFARVTEGMDVVDKIKVVKVGSKAGHQDVPIEDVIIEKVLIDE